MFAFRMSCQTKQNKKHSQKYFSKLLDLSTSLVPTDNPDDNKDVFFDGDAYSANAARAG
jgi:hypothetical protein